MTTARLRLAAVSAWTITAALALGLAAGVLSGMFGVGGGILFVPTLVALGLGQVEAAATSLLAIVPTAAVGALRQRAYGNLRVQPPWWSVPPRFWAPSSEFGSPRRWTRIFYAAGSACCSSRSPSSS